ncbi:MAG: glycogen debranching enzyme N-terminal domain-containing protein, partial [Paludibacteraceae bacterium]|nr:glycogen debranching enzyme N-terminal domain-containing protein [Paludibacteraceae bacterium]
MSYISFDKRDLQNIGRTLSKEILNTNRSGVFSLSSLIGCNTRKYHGLLILPIEGTGLDDGNYVLLSSLDETVVQYGAEFNLAVHHYGYDIFAPNGHKYIREFDCVRANKITYRVGSVIIVK